MRATFVVDAYHQVLKQDVSDVDKFIEKNYFPPTLVARELFERRYGISITQQLAWEAQIEKKDFSFLSSLEPRDLSEKSDHLDYLSKYIEEY
jgi:hypothetical protein